MLKNQAQSLPKVLVSGCLLGQPVRYDGGHKLVHHPVLQGWLANGQVIGLCPETAGGLPTPRLPAELVGGPATAVLLGQAQVRDSAGNDVSAAFVQGAQLALQLVQQHGIQVAVLKEGSPSCGSGQVYDGQFAGQLIAGDGVTCALLRQAGVQVFGEQDWQAAALQLQQLTSPSL